MAVLYSCVTSPIQTGERLIGTTSFD